MKIGRILLSFLAVLLLSSCHGSKKKQTMIPEATIASEIKLDKKGNDKISNLLSIAQSWLGVPYKYGGNDRGGVDCSGMVVQVFLNAWNMKLPRTCVLQSEFCQVIDKKYAQPGDLVFFATGSDPDRISHVGILLDDDRFIHSSSTKGVVVSHLSKPYYQRTFRQCGRIPSDVNQ